ncbi:hypothetical protein [Pseudophaeobacter arcticus]|jgi:hypothetical protein|uniref:hypothetical protein n=1 Tax=Pseudophaeobacter arcticus TaxID=385492 RepID=UPI0039E37949
MLINIYARSMMTAARQPCVLVRDLPAAAGTGEKTTPGRFAKVPRLFKSLAMGLQPKARQARQPLRCIDLQKL